MRYITFSMHGRSKNRLNYWWTECCCWKKSELLWVREWEWKGSMYAFIESVANDGSFSTHCNPLLHQNQLSVNTKIEKKHTHTHQNRPNTKHQACPLWNVQWYEVESVCCNSLRFKIDQKSMRSILFIRLQQRVTCDIYSTDV